MAEIKTEQELNNDAAATFRIEGTDAHALNGPTRAEETQGFLANMLRTMFGEFIRTVNNTEPDANGNVTIVIPAGFSGSWNDLTNKPATFTPTAHNHTAGEVVESGGKRFVSDAEKLIWSSKQDALTFDSAPTASSTNPVTSGGVQAAIAAIQGAPPKTPIALTDGATVTWDFSQSVNAHVTLGGNRTLAITNVTAGSYGTLRVVQDAVGSRTLTLPAGSKVIGGGAGAVTLTATANAMDLLSFYYNGTNFFWSVGQNYN